MEGFRRFCVWCGSQLRPGRDAGPALLPPPSMDAKGGGRRRGWLLAPCLVSPLAGAGGCALFFLRSSPRHTADAVGCSGAAASAPNY